MLVNDKSQIDLRLGKSIEAFVRLMREVERSSPVECIALVTTDDLVQVTGYYLLREDVCDDFDDESRFSAFDWNHRFDESCFESINEYLDANRERLLGGDLSYSLAVDLFYQSAASHLREHNIRSTLTSLYFVTFMAADSNQTFDLAERAFVEAMNPPAVIDAWKEYQGIEE